MKIFPAIDLKEGKCVRLKKGDYGQVKTYSDDPIMIAEQWVNQGTKNLHIIDLDGAKAGIPINHELISKIKQRFPSLYIQVGGGIRREDNIKMYIDMGVDRMIIGTKIIKEPEFLSNLDHTLQKKIIVDIAVKDNMLALEGWHQLSEFDMKSFVAQLQESHIPEIVYTDIEKDGMLLGINLPGIKEFISFSEIPVIISGGITSTEDIKQLRSLEELGISGMIIGKALYENTIKLHDVINLCSE